MKKNKLIEIVNGLRKIANTLSADAKDFADKVIAAFDELANDTDEHNVTELQDKIAEIAGEIVKKASEEQQREVENAIAKARQTILSQVQNAVKPENKLSKELAKEVANAIFACKGGSAEVRNTVAGILKKNDVTGLTAGVIMDYAINLKVESNEALYDALHKTRFTKFLYSEIDRKQAKQIAHQWDKSSKTEKAIQDLEFQTRDILTDYIYKRQRFAFADLDEIKENGQLQEFLAEISAELRLLVKSTIVSTILVGDTVNEGADRITTFETIGTKTESDAFTSVLKASVVLSSANATAVGLDTLQSKLLYAARQTATRIWNPTNKKVVMCMHKDMLTNLAVYRYAEGGDVSFRSKEEVAAMIGVDEIYTTDVMDNTVETGKVAFIALIPDEYWVKEKNVFDVAYPTYEFNASNMQYEINAGGKIHGLLSTALFKIDSEL